ncbi:unnamed protein product [Chilo suppressalis]|uniref:Uncharacterized protein n=1 Tax=Chilo suppressalis TaxID=168631 RepID=A0ABN8B4B0_CHISP|nr:unnamed protein product [Chilo suppressalis]
MEPQKTHGATLPQQGLTRPVEGCLSGLRPADLVQGGHEGANPHVGSRVAVDEVVDSATAGTLHPPRVSASTQGDEFSRLDVFNMLVALAKEIGPKTRPTDLSLEKRTAAMLNVCKLNLTDLKDEKGFKDYMARFTSKCESLYKKCKYNMPFFVKRYKMWLSESIKKDIGQFIAADSRSGSSKQDVMLSKPVDPYDMTESGPSGKSIDISTPAVPPLKFSENSFPIIEALLPISEQQVAISELPIQMNQPVTTLEPSFQISEPQLLISEALVAITEPPLPILEPSLLITEPPLPISEPSLLISEQADLRIPEPQIINPDHSFQTLEPQLPIAEPTVTISQPSLPILETPVLIEQNPLQISEPLIPILGPCADIRPSIEPNFAQACTPESHPIASTSSSSYEPLSERQKRRVSRTLQYCLDSEQ